MVLNYFVNVCPPLFSYQERKEKIWGPDYNEFLPRLCVKSMKTRCSQRPRGRTGPGRAPEGPWCLGFYSKGEANGSLNYAVPYFKTKVMSWTWLPDVKSVWGDIQNICKMQVLSFTERYWMVYDQCPAFYFFPPQTKIKHFVAVKTKRIFHIVLSLVNEK